LLGTRHKLSDQNPEKKKRNLPAQIELIKKVNHIIKLVGNYLTTCK